MKYNWQLIDWTNFRYNTSEIDELAYDCLKNISLFAGNVEALPKDIKQEAIIHFMVSEAVKTSAIEGEIISREDVFSSIRNHFGLNTPPQTIKNLKAEGISKVMLNAYHSFSKPLSKKMLNEWHSMLFQGQLSSRHMTIGKYRTHKGPMQIVSGPVGKEKIHFTAPPSKDIEKEMKKFILWFNQTAPGAANEIKAAPVRSAIAHLYFESIHPYEDGNGRIGRAISEKALAQSLGYPILISLSQEIEANKKKYYSNLKDAQQSNEITDWVRYFLEMINFSTVRTKSQLTFVLDKARFFDKFKNELNQRQKKVINRMLEEGSAGFQGGITAKKYISITKCSKATATRDLTHLLTMQAIKKLSGKGRNVSYELLLHEQ